MAGITTARGLAVLSPRPAAPRSGTYFCGLNSVAATLVAEKMSLFVQNNLFFYAARVSASMAGFGPHCRRIGTTPASSDWHSARFVLRRKLGHTGWFSAPEMATCTISCRKKVLGKRLDYRYRLPATTWLRCGVAPPATFVAQHVPKQIGTCVFCSWRGGIPEA